EDMLEEYAQCLRLLFDPEGRRANFQGKHFRLENAPNFPKPLQPRVPIWIGGKGEKRTLRAAAKYADGWNAPYIAPAEWIQKGRVLDRWCETEKRDPSTIARTVNLGLDRKSTRLNSSHGSISYAVFCLKTKRTHTRR